MKSLKNLIRLLPLILLVAICANAQGQTVPMIQDGQQTKSQNNLQYVGAINSADASSEDGQNTAAANSREAVLENLANKLGQLIVSSDTNLDGQNMIQLLVDTNNLPINGFANLSASDKEQVQLFTDSFKAKDPMQIALLKIYTRLSAEIN